MWKVAMALSGALAGFITGMVLSEVIAIVAYMLIHRSWGIPYISLYLAGVGALIGLFLAKRRPEVTNSGS